MAVLENYAFDLFETHGTAAPVRREEPRKEPVIVPLEKPLRKVPGKSKKQRRLEQRLAAVRTLLILVFAAAFMTMLCFQISVGAKSYELKRQIAAAEEQLQETKSENVRLNSALNSITTIDKITTYAIDVLGMTKAEGYQVECIDLSDGDVILFAGGSSTGADANK